MTSEKHSNADKSSYLSVPDDKVFPKHRIVFKSGRNLNLFGVKKINLDGSWSRVWDHRGKCFMYDPESVDYIEIDEG